MPTLHLRIRGSSTLSESLQLPATRQPPPRLRQEKHLQILAELHETAWTVRADALTTRTWSDEVLRSRFGLGATLKFRLSLHGAE